MRKNFHAGDTVRLTPAMRRSVINPDLYQCGQVTDDAGYYGIYYVKWGGIGRPIAMRSDEIELASEEVLPA